MSDAGATIKIDADTTSAVSKVKKLGDEVAKVGGKSGQVDFGKGVNGLGKMLVSSGALLRTAEAIANAFLTAADNAGKLSKSAGGSRLDRDQAAQRAGLNAGRVNAIVEGTAGGATQESRDALLGALGGVKGLSVADKYRALQIGTTGVVGNDEILEAAKNGGLAGLQGKLGGRFGAMSPQAQRELAMRSLEQQKGVQVNATAGGFGDAARIGAANRALSAAESPILGGIANAAQDLPVVGTFSKAVETGGMQASAVQELKAIRQNTGGKLNLSARGENGQ